MLKRLSLAGKCLVLFGAAVVLIVLAALWVGWLRMATLVDEGQLDVNRQLVDAWERLDDDERAAGPLGLQVVPQVGKRVEHNGISATRWTLDQAGAAAKGDEFLASALKRFAASNDRADYQAARWTGTTREYFYAKAVRARDTARLTGIIVLERRSIQAARLVVTNIVYLLLAGGLVLTMALLVFYIITRRVILAPMLALKTTAERVREGNLAIRADLDTGDEFQELSETLNSMLGDLQSSQDRLRSINAALDVKLHELTESNNALYQAAKVKGDFLANVSHELRTPLNSINGFAELLLEQAKSEQGVPDAPPSVTKRARYLENILTAGRGLLALINSLLEMARIEAGRVELRIEKMNLRDACEGLIGLISPLADKKGILLSLEVSDDAPVILTDAKKFQQVLFNFLSNAVKFTVAEARTGRTPKITLRAERLVASGPGAEERVRVSVIDNGPGIAPDEQSKIFEKFYQMDAGHTREHAGTGLGLSISKELAGILGGEIQVLSEVGRGSMFSLILPLELKPPPPPLPADEPDLRGEFASGLRGA
ncbi:MAG: HAMP domain-containing sensor histidine kinase [Phycisphaerales bacterium]|jgi:signal transduction histidine kinase